MCFESPLTLWVSNIPSKQVGVYASKGRRDARIESLRSFHLAFIDEFAVPGKKFNATAFNAKVNEGNANFRKLSPTTNSLRVVRCLSISKHNLMPMLRI